ncbi:MAG: alpha-1,4-glucan--maltose-1-phosphate maltosyltransferase [Acidobacteria bacterium RIFCSPLOWO2_02_FULL_67_36]|nr:MAG: alpha-1,4-glucan--maltose-1-phosphate maltosyltransferase [Acidobacteria bacterium RIFCSPLOWO2_02_FULL_67_36]OFW19161.1 MAG: alpha-1,4-glucan--maltose-1-phosphate maltosyltransferase [Acidobacteria bacterium RIFCSPLOWO2_12_FULL_66_21]
MDPALQRRVVIEHVRPQVDCGRFPIKRVVGERVVVRADVFADGHDVVAAVLLYRKSGDDSWREAPMTALGNDEWTASFTVEDLGRYEYTVEGWVDRFASWRVELSKKAAAGQVVASELLEGAALVDGVGHPRAGEIGGLLRDVNRGQDERVAAALSAELEEIMAAGPDRASATRFDRVLEVVVDPPRARFGAWYEMFPRSAGTDPSRGATFEEAAARLPYVASMGFDVLYLPPIHPIGRSFRKGPNNALEARAGDPGSPWAIGSEQGGHTAVDPGLGTLEDFDRFVAAAARHGLEIALDIAYQASPDHPYVHEHPEWFRRRPDGTIKYAENPPKKYQDIYPIDFESAAWRELWAEMKRIVEFWIGHGVKIFRVDNPHTKPFGFWQWALGEIKRDHPETIFLSEAFTRPKIMRYLAKTGFSQSYSYFTWRNTKQELTEYFTELTQTDVREYMRPNLFANTPDILHEYLQRGGRPAFEVRLVLAATLGASYGIYSGFELAENVPIREDSEEYCDSEKYRIRVRDVDRPGTLAGMIGRVNAIRHNHPALQHDWGLEFHQTDNPELLCYSKRSTDGADLLLMVVNLDPFHIQHGFVQLPLGRWGFTPQSTVEVLDLLSEERYFWRGEWNYVRLDPPARVAHILQVKQPAPLQSMGQP